MAGDERWGRAYEGFSEDPELVATLGRAAVRGLQGERLTDKDRVLAEAFRVLKPGGRFAVSDVVVRGEIPASMRGDMESWAECLAGALEEQDYRRRLAAAWPRRSKRLDLN